MTTAEHLIDGCVSPFNSTQRQRLQDLRGAPLDEYIEVLHDMYPEKFHTEASLKTRVFFDEPSGLWASRRLPYARFVRPFNQSPYWSTP
jgi:hypothetical protein